MNVSYIINELGEERENYFQAIAPPIVQTSNFAFRTVEEMRERFKDEYSGYLYSRGLNPTVDILRKKLAALDGAEDALVFNSGAAAIYSAIVPFVQKGDHIISVAAPYTWAQKLFDQHLPRFGVTTTYVDARDSKNIWDAVNDSTRIIYLESPNSWDFAIQDLRAIAMEAKKRNILTVVDNSYCSPIYQRPIEMGIDLCLQSATKYIGGHSDVVAGVLSGTRAHMKKIFDLEYLMAGNGIQAFNAWLLIRGLRTLPARLDRITINTHKVIAFMKSHPKVEELLFPLEESFPQYQLAKSQMSGACGLFTIVVKSQEADKIENFCQSLKRFLMAVSWGGHESLVIPRMAGVSKSAFNPNMREHRMIRFYVGLEDAEYLIEDLQEALEKL
ncbi:MAG: aminotransferase class I/II-fold pyridoxal phosphate-dependent enzyme [Saprospiraceae bacterium]|nr:aminotransferase class I/II-fold pyridoxal phosphate-dependent enzyme [Candidatus Vicinibacter affinis]MBP6173268.1 aminotransferase class I/II-fold pyridoxal phosphate-dependent enzyme [Saprospiraceae bacterium]MBK6824205.1 aminotransferase class I/II-fold pyridoxal phosphate-dependent enzyme [Candidatus Vicinibacter affinis]MBK7303821.1 aminotransferase class I/II-fold pyridoxal phosphate-dependent enzyme [Candidatus Vicinibacter affinis]MBK7799181.1 aminotransferase class I/II-fold pyrido